MENKLNEIDQVMDLLEVINQAIEFSCEAVITNQGEVFITVLKDMFLGIENVQLISGTILSDISNDFNLLNMDLNNIINSIKDKLAKNLSIEISETSELAEIYYKWQKMLLLDFKNDLAKN